MSLYYSLSRMGLKSEDLPSPLLSKLHNLEHLDLSGNMLQEFPKGVCLPSLKILDCSNNEMEDVVSLEGLSNMEELRLEDNIYLTVRITSTCTMHYAMHQSCYLCS